MRPFSLEELKQLAGRPNGPCVSIYMPIERPGGDTQQNPIRLKNLLREAEEQILAAGLRTPEARAILEPAENLLLDGHFWRYQREGLALFLSEALQRSYRLPLRFQELAIVAPRFHLKPLLSLLSDDGRFYVLALSQNQVRLLEGTRFTVSEVGLEDVPTSLAEALQTEEVQKQLQFRTNVSPTGPGQRAAMFHGHGADAVDAKERLLRYFHRLDEGLREFLRDERVPLVLAAVDYLHPIYSSANSYPHLTEGQLVGNPDNMSAAELHQQAWEVIEPLFMQAQEEAAGRYRALSGTGRTSKIIEEIVPAAHHGRVETLFVAVGIQQWGRYDPVSGEVELHAQPERGAEDLLDLAALQTILNSGSVYAVAPAKIPDEAPLAAVYRY